MPVPASKKQLAPDAARKLDALPGISETNPALGPMTP